MKKCAIFIPYFQKLLPWQKLLLKTIQWNPDFDFILLNFDNKETELVNFKNIITINLIEQDFFNKIQSKLEINIKVKTKAQIQKKYSDYSITFGAIFEDLLQNYSMWGIMNPNTLIPNINKLLLNCEPNDAEIFIPPSTNGNFYIFRNITAINYLFSRINNVDSKLSNITNYSLLSSLRETTLTSLDIKTKIIQEQVLTANISYPFSFIINNKYINNTDKLVIDFTEVNNGDNMNYLLNDKFTIENKTICKFKQFT